jgi:CBS domain-containing protein
VDVADNLNSELVEQAGPVAPLCVEPETPVRRVLELLAELGRGAALVCRQGRLVGIFTERDALGILAGNGDLDAPVERFMARDPVTLRPSDTVGSAIARMSVHGYRRLPIVDAEGRPTGLLDVAGVVHWLVEHFPAAVYNLPPVANPITREREGP